MTTQVLRLNFRQRFIGETQNVGNVDYQERAGLENLKVPCNHRSQQGLPTLKRQIPLIGFADEIGWRPNAERNGFRLNLAQKVFGVADVDGVWLQKRKG